MIAQKCRSLQDTNQIILDLVSPSISLDYTSEFLSDNRRLAEGTIGVSIEAVPQPIALAPDRFYIWLLIDFERWAIPIQLTELEARSLLPLVEGERDRSVILKIVESAIVDGGAV